MFYDNTHRIYKLTCSDGLSEEMTMQDLFEFFIMSEHGYSHSFEELVEALDKSDVNVDDTQYDWNLGAYVYKGKCCLKKLRNIPKLPSKEVNNGCTHENKYIVQHFNGGVRYWVCPKCKADLGDA